MKINSLVRVALATAMGLGAVGAAQAQNLLTNGDFESPVITDGCCNTVTAPNSFPGWNVTAGDINVVNGTFASQPAGTNLAFDGRQYLDLIGQSGAGAISQQFATTANRTYQLSFAYSHNLFGGLQSASGTYSVGGLTGTVTHSTGSNSDLDWQLFTGRFVAGPGANSTLNFVNTVGDSNAGLFLDGVSISVVPEPATWAMMIGGFGLVGGVARRRRATARLALA